MAARTPLRILPLLFFLVLLSACDGPSAPVNTPPVANAGADMSANVGEVVSLHGTGTDADTGTTLTYIWSFATRPAGSSATLSNATSSSASFTPDVGGTYTLSLTVSDGQASHTDQCDVAVNGPPTAVVGPDMTVNLGQQVQLNGGSSTDPNGDNLSYTWTLLTRPAGSAATLQNPTSATPSFTPDLGGTYVVRLVVSDGALSSDPDDCTITVNAPPVANAGADQNVTVGAVAQLNGAGSSDPDGDNLSYSWTMVTRPAGSAATLNNSTTATPSFTPDVAGTYVVRLVVSDGALSSIADDCTITAAPPNTPPVANAGPDQDVAVGALVQLDGTGSVDPDGSSGAGGIDRSASAVMSYSWTIVTKPTGSQAALSSSTSATPTFTADLEGTYVIQLVVSDGQDSSQPDQMTVAATPQTQTQLFLRWENLERILSNQQATSGAVRTTLNGAGSINFSAILGNGLVGTNYSAMMWFGAGSAPGQTGTWTVKIIIKHNGVETTLATHTFNVPYTTAWVQYEADLTGVAGGVAGDEIIVRLTLAGVSTGAVLYGAGQYGSGVEVPGTVTVTPAPSPAGVQAEGSPGIRTEVIRGPDPRYSRGG